MTDQPEPDTHILRWHKAPEPHPVLAELAAQPGEWGVVYEGDDPVTANEAAWACESHPRVETLLVRTGKPGVVPVGDDGTLRETTPCRFSARWRTDEAWAQVQVEQDQARAAARLVELFRKAFNL